MEAGEPGAPSLEAALATRRAARRQPDIFYAIHNADVFFDTSMLPPTDIDARFK